MASDKPTRRRTYSEALKAQVLVAKYADHQSLYRQEGIYARSGVTLPCSILAAWVDACGVQLQPLVDTLKAEMFSHRVLHADETPVAMLEPGAGKTRRAYLWSYCTGQFEDSRITVYNFAESPVLASTRWSSWETDAER